MVNSNVAREDLISEMTVVRNEFERGENSPAALLYQRLLATAYEWHNYGKVTIGNRSDIERVPIERLKQFYVKFYQPDNAMLVVAGKCDEAKTLELIDKYFGAIPKPTRKLDRTYTEEPPQDGERTVTLRRVGDLGLIGAVYHIPAGAHPDMVPLDILTEVLGNAPSGRLYKSLVETKKATSIQVNASSWHDPGVFEMVAEVRRGDSLEEAQSALLEGAEAVDNEKITEEEVERARLKFLKLRELTAADTARAGHRAEQLGVARRLAALFPLPRRAGKSRPRRRDARRVDLPDSQQPHQRHVHSDRRPSPRDRSAAPPIEDLFANFKARESVAAGEAFDTSPKNIDTRSQPISLGKGIKGLLLPKETRGHSVHMQLNLRYGSRQSLSRYRAAGDLLPTLMLRGTKELTRAQIQDRLDKNLASLSAEGDKGVVSFSLETKRASLPVVLDLLRQILREPSLPAEEWSVMQRESLANLDEQLTDPQSLALVRMRRTINPYSKDDVRYIATPQEEIEEVGALKIGDFQKLYADFLGSQAGELTLVGDFDPDEVRPLLDKLFVDWKAKQPYERLERSSSTKYPAIGKRFSRRTRPTPCSSPARRLPCVTPIPTTLRWRWVRSSSAVAPCRRGWETASARRKGCPTASVRRCRPTRSIAAPAS